MDTSKTQAEVTRIVEEHFKAEASMNIDAIMATYTDDIEFDVGGMPEVLRGKQAAAGFYRQLFSDLLTDKVTPLRRLVGPTFFIDDAMYECRAVGRPFGLEGKNRPVKFRLMHVFEIRDGKICRENAWLDVGAIQRQLS